MSTICALKENGQVIIGSDLQETDSETDLNLNSNPKWFKCGEMARGATGNSMTMNLIESPFPAADGSMVGPKGLVGIRPEHLHLNPKDSDVKMQVKIRCVESVGKENIVRVEWNHKELFLTSAENPAMKQNNIMIGFSMDHLHTFLRS